MSVEAKVRLRDRREPGHFWIDNEIIDVFGDDLGQNGISVYSTMARFCYGTEVKISLREIAAAARMSKDTVARSMKVLVALGLVVETKGTRAKTASIWSLVSVKALVQALRSQTVSPRDSLKEDANPPIASAAKDMTLVGLLKEQRQNCLTMRQNGDADDSVDKKICVAQDETDLSQMEGGFETDLSHQTGALIYKTQDTKLQDKNLTPQPPSQASGARIRVADVEARSRNADDEAVQRVMVKCNLSNERLRPVIARAMAAHRLQTAKTVEAVAELMIENRLEFVRLGTYMRHSIGARRFFGEGYWIDWQLWPLDQARLDRSRNARIGT